MLLRSISTGLLVAGLFLPTQRDISVRVERVESPAHPVNTLAAGLVVTEIEIERISGKIQTRVLCGEPLFVASALEALKEWRFIVPSEADIGRTSVTFLFRPPGMYPVKIGATAVCPWNLDADFPALPQHVIDPGYPPASLATGAAILEVQVNTSGIVTGTRTIAGVRPLTDKAQEAIKKWKFSPARISGQRASSTVFVVVSFVLPN
jgi:TonB family protein